MTSTVPVSDTERSEQLARTGGAPVVDFGGMPPYVEYTRAESLLRMQHPNTDVPAELTFLIVGQVQELLFKLLHEELRRARNLLDADDVAGAVRVLRQVRGIADLTTASWDTVATMSPVEFVAFRDRLGSASGFQSFMYRMVEFVLGNKVPEMARPYDGAPGVAELVQAALHAPSLDDAVVALLARRGGPPPRPDHDPTVARPFCPEVERAWVQVYQGCSDLGALHDLAEALVAVAEGMSRWRATHLLVVERVIGTKPGTGGTSGVDWLRRITEHRYFPELWSARRLLNDPRVPAMAGRTTDTGRDHDRRDRDDFHH